MCCPRARLTRKPTAALALLLTGLESTLALTSAVLVSLPAREGCAVIFTTLLLPAGRLAQLQVTDLPPKATVQPACACAAALGR